MDPNCIEIMMDWLQFGSNLGANWIQIASKLDPNCTLRVNLDAIWIQIGSNLFPDNMYGINAREAELKEQNLVLQN